MELYKEVNYSPFSGCLPLLIQFPILISFFYVIQQPVIGADGVQIGTRFIIAHECNVHQNYKNKVLKAKDTDTAVTGRKTGHPVRVIKNKLVNQFKELDKNNADIKEYENLGRRKLYIAAIDGDVDYGSVMSGQIAGLVNREQNCKEIISEMFGEAEKIIMDLNSFLGGANE